MKACFVSCQYPPLSRTLRRYKFARYLADGGLDVEVVAHGNISTALGTFSEDAALVPLAAELPTRRPRALPWYLMGELLFRGGLAPCPYVNWLVPAARAAARIATGPRDAVIGVYPPLTNLLAAARAARRTGARLILDFRDEYLGLSGGLRRGWAQACEPRLVRAAHLLSVATPSLRSTLLERYALPAERVQLTLNGYWDEVPACQDYPDRDGLRLVYVGALSPAQGLEVLCDALELVRARQPAAAAQMTVTVYGPQNLYLRRHLRPRLLQAGVRYGGFLPADQVTPTVLAADACFVPLASAAYAYAVPGKLYECIAHARPLLAVLPPGPARRIVEDERFGVVADCGSPQQLAAALLQLLDRGRRRQLHANLLHGQQRYAARPQFLSLAARIQELGRHD